jgi:hypothetical protein
LFKICRFSNLLFKVDEIEFSQKFFEFCHLDIQSGIGIKIWFFRGRGGVGGAGFTGGTVV